MNLDKYTKEARIFENEHHDNCSVCGRSFKDNESTHLGLNEDGQYLYVGDCCQNEIKELIVSHIFSKREYIIPDKESKLWRFMDIGKFLSLIQTKSLFFARSDQFSDPFEGAKGVLSRETEWQGFYTGFIFQAIKQAEVQLGAPVLTTSERLEKAKRLYRDFKTSNENERYSTFINCWHENEFESEAMWQLYTSNINEGIAIQTSYERLYDAIDRNPSIAIGRVNYIDFNSRYSALGSDAFFFKRKSFEHEKEVRMITNRRNETNSFGIYIPINLGILIENIYISPTCKQWFENVIKDVALKYDINKPIHRSTLNVTPFF